MRESLQTYLDFMNETVYLAGRTTLGYFLTGVAADVKADNSPVTVADRLSEDLIRGRIEKRFPHHTIVGEEHGVTENDDADHRWFIDPIDGTKSFLHGVPLYSVLIGLEIEGKVEAGVAYFPALDELVSAASGLGCWWNGRRAHVSTVSLLSQGVMSFTDIGNMYKYGRMAAFERLMRTSYFRAGWNDAYGYMLVATGRVELMFDPVMAPWDAAPFPAILREAGGYFGDWQGNETIFGNEGLATTQTLLPEVLKLIQGKTD
jgi:histidinol-phosphatase